MQFHPGPLALALAFALLTSTSPAQTSFTLRTLPPLPGDAKAFPVVSNAHGVVAGYSAPTSNVMRPTVWIGGVPQQLPELPGGGRTSVTSINQLGEVVGVVAYAPKYRPTQAWIWDPVGGLRELLGPNGGGNANDINDFGLVVGSSPDTAGIDQLTTWDRAGNATVIGSPPGYALAIATSVNNAGEMVGIANKMGTPSMTAFRWNPVVGFQLLFPLTSGGETEANGITSSGRAIGTDLASGQVVTWDGLLPAPRGHGPNGVLSHGQTEIAQGWLLADAHTYGDGELFEGAFVRRVADLFPPSHKVTNTYGCSLSDGGLIVGSYWKPVGTFHGFVLEPEVRVEVEGGQAAGSIAFRHRAPTHPNELAATLVSLTGMAATVGVGRGATVRLDFDAATTGWLALPGAGLVTLNGNGNATTAALDLGDPTLAGIEAWVCSVVLPGGGARPATSTTVPFILE